MKNISNKLYEQAMRDCTDERMKEVVYNNTFKEFSYLEIFVEYRNIKGSALIPKWYDYQFPNASKYEVMSRAIYGKLEGKEMWLVQDKDRKEKVVKILKKIHNIKDPWDDDPNWFKTHKPGDEL